MKGKRTGQKIVVAICIVQCFIILYLSQTRLRFFDAILKDVSMFSNNDHISTVTKPTDIITTLVDIPSNFKWSLKSTKGKLKIAWPNAPHWIVRRNNANFTCEYSNCYTSEGTHDIESAVALVFVPSLSNMGSKPPISPEKRNPNQVWVFYSLEPPMNFYYSDYLSSDWLNTMNWSMTYRLNSDIFAPYGTLKSRADPPKKNYGEIFDKKTKMAVGLVSHCNAESQRDLYMKQLIRSGLDVDIFGQCGSNLFGGNIFELVANYKFILAFENCLCEDYITEKVFERYNMDVILVVRGGADYKKLLPQGTYINTADFKNTSHLTEFLKNTGGDKDLYINYLTRKDKYIAYNEDDFGHIFALCELCRKLNHIQKYRNMHVNMKDFFLNKSQCIVPKDIPTDVSKEDRYQKSWYSHGYLNLHMG